jgi:hypothetical protein
MKSIVFLALVAAAVAHWPYAEQEDKFRVSGLSLLGSSLALDPTFYWIFSPLNNQLLPTFQIRFPHAPLSTSNSQSGLVYTIVLDHLAEVLPNGGTFTLVPGTTINFNDVIWFTDTFTRFYDDESMGEVIEFLVQAYDSDVFDDLTDTGDATGDSIIDMALFPVSIRIRLFPDSADDLVDLTVHIHNYTFVDTETVNGVELPETHLAIFYKIAASTGDEPSRVVPLSLDYEAISFEVDGDVKFDACSKKRSMRRNNATKTTRKTHAPVVANSRTMKKLAKVSRQVDMFPYPDTTLEHTTVQLWISSGYVAAVIGVVPDDLATCVSLQTTSTIAVRTFRAVPTS